MVTITMAANKLNAPSMPPAMKTDRVGLSCSCNTSTNLPALIDFHSSAALLLTL